MLCTTWSAQISVFQQYHSCSMVWQTASLLSVYLSWSNYNDNHQSEKQAWNNNCRIVRVLADGITGFWSDLIYNTLTLTMFHRRTASPPDIHLKVEGMWRSRTFSLFSTNSWPETISCYVWKDCYENFVSYLIWRT